MDVMLCCTVGVLASVVLIRLGDVGSTLRGVESVPSAEHDPWARRVMSRRGTGTVAWRR